uniref:INO80 complex subunit E n=1 Tax=Pelusios castaneus TaxID=367368 RepID=A0A8C8S7A9_9SAUR
MNGAEAEPGSYKRRYRALKRRLKLLIYEQECFQEELRKAQRKLLKVSRDKSFLLDRLLQYENVDEESSGSAARLRRGGARLGGRSGAVPLELCPSLPSFPSPRQLVLRFGEVGLGSQQHPLTSLPFFPLQMPLTPATHPDCSVVGGLPFSSPRGGPGSLATLASKLPPPTILSTVPQQMFSDAGEGSGEDPLDGDDELVIDIPE